MSARSSGLGRESEPGGAVEAERRQDQPEPWNTAALTNHRTRRRLVLWACAVPCIGFVGYLYGPADPGYTIATDATDVASTVDVEATTPVTLAIVDPAAASSAAVRVDTVPESTTAPTWLLPEPAPAGLWGMPFAPDGLDDCGQAEFYRTQWGLPEAFIHITWREARCINREDVRTSCCTSRYQLHVGLHMRNDELRLRYVACEVFDESDLDGPEPVEQQRAACAARALFDVAGMDPWRLP